jgi:AraC-like DNA-binding protein
MVHEIKYFSLPKLMIDEQKTNPLIMDLYFTEIGEIAIGSGTIWDAGLKPEGNFLLYCEKGNSIIQVLSDQFPVSSGQFFIVPQGESFKVYSLEGYDSELYVACFSGTKTKNMVQEFRVVRNLIPSVNNMVANRAMLFDEIFNNLSIGFHDENLEYVNHCFGHLLATFVFAHRTSDDLADESNPVVRQAIDFMGKSLGQKLTLKLISEKVGYSPTYFTTLFNRETGYSPLSYFSHLKILKACEFLDFTNLKIKQISFSLGYTDPYYFTRDFTKKMGLSPHKYRHRVISRSHSLHKKLD